MGRRANSEPGLLSFWSSVREVLCIAYGQDGHRQRSRMRAREELAEGLGLQDVTLRGFINGKPKTLGDVALRRLLAKCPDLDRLYNLHRTIEESGEKAPSGASESAIRQEQPTGVQMELVFEGFEVRGAPVKLRLPPGNEGVVSLKLKAG
jgi:hypothetical protein